MANGPTPFPYGTYIPYSFFRGLAFANLPAGGSGKPGWLALCTDSPTNTPGASITVGGGSNTVFAWWDGSHWIVLGGIGEGSATPYLDLAPTAFASLPASPAFGMIAAVSDSTVNALGAEVTVGGGTDEVIVWYDGSHWIVGMAVTGSTYLTTGAAVGSNGLTSTPLRLTEAKSTAGVPLTASATGGAFGVALTLGTSIGLSGEATSSNSKTDSAVFEYVLPPNYIAGQNVNVTVHGNYSVGSGAASGTNTVAVAAYLTAANGTQGSNLVATAAAALTASDAANAFVITGATLVPGSLLSIEVTEVITNGTGASTGHVNGVTLS